MQQSFISFCFCALILEQTHPKEHAVLMVFALLGIVGFTGPLPTEFGNLGRLTTLRVADNHFEGSLPSELGRLTSLNVLTAAVNNFTGTLPLEFGSLVHLQELNISGNEFTGALPEALCKVENLDFDCLPDTFCGCDACTCLERDSNADLDYVVGLVGNSSFR